MIIWRMLFFFLSGALVSCSKSTNTVQTSDNTERPNIILIMADDMGFSDIGAYGGEVHTPNLDRLAKNGLRYTQFYNNARCCPTRASLMTGLYPHQAGMGWMTTADLGTPAYQGEINKQSVTIAEVLKDAGYATYMSGKWHLSRNRNIKAGIQTNWPKQRGFDRFFGIVGGASNYFTPRVFSDNQSYKAPDKGFYFTHAISDSSVMFMDQHFKKQVADPFFMYVAYTAPHWPLHALQEDIEKYRETYKAGWDNLRRERLKKQKEIGIFEASVKLLPRDEKVPAWNDLSADKQKEFAMRMAIYAAQIDAMDQGIGRIVNKLKEEGKLENTLIFFLSDNGACAEYVSSGKSRAVNGKENTFESYRIHWANLGSTPYKEYKHWIHEGGIATPLVVHWPNGIEGGNKWVREPGHINDIMATCVAVARAEYPAVYKGNTIHPMEGQSLVPHFHGATNNRQPIFWEHEANIGVRDGQWKLVVKTEEGAEFDPGKLELYNMEEDPSELNDLAKTFPDKRDAMYSAWKVWADRVNVHFDTRKYAHRTEAYQRMLNGEFDEFNAGWSFSGKKLDFIIDSTNQVSGRYAAQISNTGSHQNGGTLTWTFHVEKGEAFDISVKAKASDDEKMKVYFDQVTKQIRLGEKLLNADQKVREIKLTTHPANVSGRYQLAVEVPALKPGEQIWIDDVRLKKRE